MPDEEKIKVPRFKTEAGFVTTEDRSKLMGKIKANNTIPELILRKAIWALGLRYRINVKKIKGCPDIVISKYKIAIFIDGEFWHGYNWEDKKNRIKVNRDFWIPKIERNMQRDVENKIALEKAGYTVIRFWANEVKKDVNNCLQKIIGAING